MTRALIPWLALVLAAHIIVGCQASPLPMPPTMDPEAITMVGEGDSVTITGSANAISEGGVTLRFSAVAPPHDGAPEDVVETSSDANGGFVVTCDGAVTYRFYVEAVIPGTHAFLGALAPACLMCAGHLEVVITDPGSDRDNDGSPDLIDCAPDDESLVGQQCQ